jgi:G3E family GTPase
VNRILTQKAGRRVAVVENEFGEVNIDRALGEELPQEWRVVLEVLRALGIHWSFPACVTTYATDSYYSYLANIADLLLGSVSENLIAKEDVVSLENGCVCCSLRSDIIDALKELEERTRRYGARPIDAVLLETTGLADPGPVVSPTSPSPLKFMALTFAVVSSFYHLCN